MPHLDRYDPEGLDESIYSDMSQEARQRAEYDLNQRRLQEAREEGADEETSKNSSQSKPCRSMVLWSSVIERTDLQFAHWPKKWNCVTLVEKLRNCMLLACLVKLTMTRLVLDSTEYL